MIEGSGHSGLLRMIDRSINLKRSKARIITNISVPEEKKYLIEWAEKRAKLDGVSRSIVLEGRGGF